MHGALAAALWISVAAAGQPSAAPDAAPEPERFSLHYQATVATQAHPSFTAAYTGPHSLRPSGESATSVVMDLFAGLRAWPGGELYFQPELAGGRGLSSTLGVASFPSGEVYRVGDPDPTVVVARLFVRQVLGLGGGEVRVEPGPNQLGGVRDRDALTLTLGRFAVPDVFDAVSVSNDPHLRFTSWGLWASAAYDYPADTRGYTWGLAADASVDWWSVRAGLFLEPSAANAMTLEWNVAAARGLVAEVEGRFALGDRPGVARLLGFLNTARMGSYAQALAAPGVPDVAATRAQGRTKAGFAASVQQELGHGLAAFLRLSWNDGANESWAFTEVDRSAAAGAVQSGAPWSRPDDEVGVGLVVSDVSAAHRRYLEAGGLGFLLGDGALSHAVEVLGEVFYRLALSREIAVIGTYQPIFDPGFNSARGPVHVFTGRVHVAF